MTSPSPDTWIEVTSKRRTVNNPILAVPAKLEMNDTSPNAAPGTASAREKWPRAIAVTIIHFTGRTKIRTPLNKVLWVL
jgi:hypothetical protein